MRQIGVPPSRPSNWTSSEDTRTSLYRSLLRLDESASSKPVNVSNFNRAYDYVGQNALNGSTKSKLTLHPTVKPVAMIADAIRDCSNRGGLILDPFGGAGTTLIAAERTGRWARLIELNPTFVDLSIERWQRLTGGVAVNADTHQPFARGSRGRASEMEEQIDG